jgi:hypothetical protein
MAYLAVPRETSEVLFEVFHPAHVLLSAIATAAMHRLHGRGRWWATILIGYVGAVGICTLSDCLIPYLGEWLLGVADENVHAEAHIGFIEHWWLVNPLALLGCVIAYLWPRTRLPHAGHVFLSTAASLFHVTMAAGSSLAPSTLLGAGAFLFLAVWGPCCTSDIIFPLLFVKRENWPACKHCRNGLSRESFAGMNADEEKDF